MKMRRSVLLIVLVAAMVIASAGAVMAQKTSTPETTKQSPTSDASSKQETTAPATPPTTPEGNAAAGPGPSAVPGQNGKITFASNRDSRNVYVNEIYTMNVDGSNLANLTNNSANDSGSRFSPDGKKIAFASDRDGNDEIYTMNADGYNPIRLTNNSAVDDEPAFSPDGKKIAFTSRRDGNYQIYTMNADGSNQTRLTNNPAADSATDWGVKVQQETVYGAYPYPGTYYSACTCYVTPAKSQSVSAYGMEVPSNAGYNTGLAYFYSPDGINYSFVGAVQAPNYDEGSYSLFLSPIRVANSGFWKVVAIDVLSGSQDSKIWYVY